MKAIVVGIVVVATLALTAATAAAEPGPSPREVCSMPGLVGSDFENDLFPKLGGCVSTVATGGFESGVITQAGYNQRCKQLEGFFGGYPMVFEHGPRIDIANNKQQCVALLQFFHSGGLGG